MVKLYPYEVYDLYAKELIQENGLINGRYGYTFDSDLVATGDLEKPLVDGCVSIVVIDPNRNIVCRATSLDEGNIIASTINDFTS